MNFAKPVFIPAVLHRIKQFIAEMVEFVSSQKMEIKRKLKNYIKIFFRICLCPDGLSGPYCENSSMENCENKTCLNGGNCIGGHCECPIGFSGEKCEVIAF